MPSRVFINFMHKLQLPLAFMPSGSVKQATRTTPKSAKNACMTGWDRNKMQAIEKEVRSLRTPKGNKNDIIEQSEVEKIVMNKKQLMEFTKKFAIHKVEYEEQIQLLKQRLHDRDNKIAGLEEQVATLRGQEDCLIKMVEQAKHKQMQQLEQAECRCKVMQSSKQSQIQTLKAEVTKLRQWLQQEKSENKRYSEFVKIKDEIIKNLELDLQKYKSESHNKECINNTQRKLKTTEGVVRSNSNRKIIIRRREENKQNLSAIKNTSGNEIKELANKVNYLSQQLRNLQKNKEELFTRYRETTIENQVLRKTIEKLQKQKQEQSKMDKSINNLNAITKRMKQTHSQKQNIMVTKCMFLQRQVQRLARELDEIKVSHVLSRSSLYVEDSSQN